MKDLEENPTLEEVDFMQQSLSHTLMEEPTQHVPMYYMATFSTSDNTKQKGKYNLKDETPSKKSCEYNKLCHKQLTIGTSTNYICIFYYY